MGAFDGGAITSNGGVVALAAADKRIGLGQRLARCFTDLRLGDAVRHSLPDLLRQRIFGIALGHEDLIDHDALRDDPALGAVLDKPGGRLRANQLRLWLASFAYVLMCAVRRIGLAGTKLAAATCGTIRLKLSKIGALVTISVRRVELAFASACPDREHFELAARRL